LPRKRSAMARDQTIRQFSQLPAPDAR
jgi:hypothetical protein